MPTSQILAVAVAVCTSVALAGWMLAEWRMQRARASRPARPPSSMGASGAANGSLILEGKVKLAIQEIAPRQQAAANATDEVPTPLEYSIPL